MANDGLILGDWNANCAKCGFKFKASELIKESAGPGLSAMYVCRRCWRPKQPQDFVRGIPERQSVPWTQQFPDFYSFCTVNIDKGDTVLTITCDSKCGKYILNIPELTVITITISASCSGKTLIINNSGTLTLNNSGGGNVTLNNSGGSLVITAPSTLTATAVGGSQINLTWTDTTNFEDGFKIERKTGANGTYVEIASVAANTVSYNDTGLTAGLQYFYRIRSFKGPYSSAYSNEANATTITDPYFANVVLLMHFTTAQGVGWDEITDTHRLSAVGLDPTPSLSPNFKFGDAGIQAGGANTNWLESSPSTDFALGTNEMTIEFWLYQDPANPPGASATPLAHSDGVLKSWQFRKESTNQLGFQGWGNTVLTPAALPTGQWLHVAAVRNNTLNVIQLYLNGVFQNQAAIGAATNIGNSTGKINLTGTQGDAVWGPRGGGLTGNAVDDVRITKGVARYTANFTPPTAPFPDL